MNAPVTLRPHEFERMLHALQIEVLAGDDFTVPER